MVCENRVTRRTFETVYLADFHKNISVACEPRHEWVKKPTARKINVHEYASRTREHRMFWQKSNDCGMEEWWPSSSLIIVYSRDPSLFQLNQNKPDSDAYSRTPHHSSGSLDFNLNFAVTYSSLWDSNVETHEDPSLVEEVRMDARGKFGNNLVYLNIFQHSSRSSEEGRELFPIFWNESLALCHFQSSSMREWGKTQRVGQKLKNVDLKNFEIEKKQKLEIMGENQGFGSRTNFLPLLTSSFWLPASPQLWKLNIMLKNRSKVVFFLLWNGHLR